MKITRLLLFVLLSSAMIGCTSNAKQDGGDIATLEAQNEKEPTPETTEKLIGLYESYVNDNPEDIENSSKYLYRGASLYFRMNRFNSASKWLDRGIKNYSGSTNTPNNMLMQATICLERLKDGDKGKAIYQAFAEKFPEHEKAAEAKLKSKGYEGLKANIKKYQEEMYADKTKPINRLAAFNFIKMSELQGMLYSDDPETPNILHRAGETARSILNFKKAMSIYDWILEKYPNHEKTAQALFLKAFTLDNNLKKYDEAKGFYEEFLKRFPNDDFADDTKFLLENLGKTDEDIIKGFESK